MYILCIYIFTKAQKLGIKNKVGIKDHGRACHHCDKVTV